MIDLAELPRFFPQVEVGCFLYSGAVLLWRDLNKHLKRSSVAQD